MNTRSNIVALALSAFAILAFSSLRRRRKTIESTWIWAERRQPAGWGFPRLLLMAITAG